MNDDLAAATKPPRLLHRERDPSGTLVAYYRAGLSWRVYWRPDADAEAPLVGGFDSLDLARRDAAITLAFRSGELDK